MIKGVMIWINIAGCFNVQSSLRPQDNTVLSGESLGD